MDIPKHWTFVFEGMGETDTGDVITVADGEIIGTWSILDGAFYTFTPLGASEHLFLDPFLGRMCVEMREWQEARGIEGI
ncbi:hypothetical protein [Rhizobium lentis]|uniref:hypothetical protein n=1 Tax=Rhizobium lentis TaxID=1138194 RepID=UPI001C8346C2|nr:hypothetical protein [Rhizobium lentis]MBX5048108.1 hypothetical protein [Rhizobium lentis]MBX5059625.1 hypothetical protein [Rhizobium lentis]